MEAKIIKMGSLYFDGSPVNPGRHYHGRRFSFGNTVPGKELQWVDTGELLVADRCVCTYISWDDIDYYGYIFGRPVVIDGKAYWCRSLKCGARGTDPNEWDDLLDQFGESDKLWHWRTVLFWGQEPPASGAKAYRVIRGWDKPRQWVHSAKNLPAAGFRPVLEPLTPSIRLDGALIGTRIEVWGSQALSVKGQLAWFDDYDMVLRDVPGLPNDCRWAHLDGTSAIISKKAISYMRTNL